VPILLLVPAGVLALVALAIWNTDRRVRDHLDRLDTSAGRLAVLRAAIAALNDEVNRAHDRRNALGSR
jgi:hypothetical protein